MYTGTLTHRGLADDDDGPELRTSQRIKIIEGSYKRVQGSYKQENTSGSATY